MLAPALQNGEPQDFPQTQKYGTSSSRGHRLVSMLALSSPSAGQEQPQNPFPSALQTSLKALSQSTQSTHRDTTSLYENAKETSTTLQPSVTVRRMVGPPYSLETSNNGQTRRHKAAQPREGSGRARALMYQAARARELSSTRSKPTTETTDPAVGESTCCAESLADSTTSDGAETADQMKNNSDATPRESGHVHQKKEEEDKNEGRTSVGSSQAPSASSSQEQAAACQPQAAAAVASNPPDMVERTQMSGTTTSVSACEGHYVNSYVSPPPRQHLFSWRQYSSMRHSQTKSDTSAKSVNDAQIDSKNAITRRPTIAEEAKNEEPVHSRTTTSSNATDYYSPRSPPPSLRTGKFHNTHDGKKKKKRVRFVKGDISDNSTEHLSPQPPWKQQLELSQTPPSKATNFTNMEPNSETKAPKDPLPASDNTPDKQEPAENDSSNSKRFFSAFSGSLRSRLLQSRIRRQKELSESVFTTSRPLRSLDTEKVGAPRTPNSMKVGRRGRLLLSCARANAPSWMGAQENGRTVASNNLLGYDRPDKDIEDERTQEKANNAVRNGKDRQRKLEVARWKWERSLRGETVAQNTERSAPAQFHDANFGSPGNPHQRDLATVTNRPVTSDNCADASDHDIFEFFPSPDKPTTNSTAGITPPPCRNQRNELNRKKYVSPVKVALSFDQMSDDPPSSVDDSPEKATVSQTTEGTVTATSDATSSSSLSVETASSTKTQIRDEDFHEYPEHDVDFPSTKSDEKVTSSKKKNLKCLEPYNNSGSYWTNTKRRKRGIPKTDDANDPISGRKTRRTNACRNSVKNTIAKKVKSAVPKVTEEAAGDKSEEASECPTSAQSVNDTELPGSSHNSSKAPVNEHKISKRNFLPSKKSSSVDSSVPLCGQRPRRAAASESARLRYAARDATLGTAPVGINLRVGEFTGAFH